MITKPLTWAVHCEKENIVPIFSIDISSRGDLFATGGEDGVVKLWSLQKALDPDMSDTEHVMDLKAHEKPVNSVRFNPTGRLLASGGSDGVVSVAAWCQGRGDELWKTFRKWHQQKLDVSEVAWGTNERTKLLASCSFDGTIVIWDVEGGHACHTITGHKNMIKGIAWDPLGQYLASQADCEGVFIWRTSDWKCVKKIADPFREAVDCADHLRLSWSPNGMYLTGVQAYSLPQPYVAVIKRDRWNVEFCVVGHRSGVTISKWNPHFFLPRNTTSETDPDKLAMCLCLGSADRTFSLWLQTEKHPIMHMDGFFENRISDIAWSADGYTCLISSRDGFVVLCNFTEEDLGVAASYKVSPLDVFPSTSRMPVAENLQLWMLEQSRETAPVVEGQDKRSRFEIAADVAAAEGQPKRQKKTNTKDAIIPRMSFESSGSPVQRKVTESGRKVIPLKPPTQIHSKECIPLKDKKSNRMSFVHPCGNKRATTGEWMTMQLFVKNGVGDKCTVTCMEGESEKWSDDIASKAVALTGNLHFSAVATEASSLHVRRTVYDEIGIQLLSPIQLPSAVSLMISDDDWHLMSLTNCGELSLWNVKEQRLLCRASVCSLCKHTQRTLLSIIAFMDERLAHVVSTIKLSSNRLPIVVLADGRSFLYNTSLQAWTLFTDSTQPRTGHQAMFVDHDDTVELSLDALSVSASPVHIKHGLEQGIRNAVDIGNCTEYRRWLLAYVRFLSSRVSRNLAAGKGEETKLRKICSDLLQGRDVERLGVDPIVFLRNQLLPEMMKVRDLQRLCEEVLDWIERT